MPIVLLFPRSPGWLGSLASAMLCALSPLTALLCWKIGNARVVYLGVILTGAGYLATSAITSLAQGLFRSIVRGQRLIGVSLS